jgi:putative heme iron utilization protein
MNPADPDAAEELKRLQAEVDALKAELNSLIQATLRAGFNVPEKKSAKGEKCQKSGS